MIPREPDLGTAATYLATHGHPVIAQLLRHASLHYDFTASRSMGDTHLAMITLPVDMLDEWKPEFRSPTLEALRLAGGWDRTIYNDLAVAPAPAVDGWRERLDMLLDLGSDEADPSWWKINGKLDGLRETYRKAVTPDDFQDVGRRSRDIIIAAVSKVYRPSMQVAGVEQPKGSDAKSKLDLILEALTDTSRNDDLRKLLKTALDLSNTVTHSGEDRAVDALAAAQATILVVRVLVALEALLPNEN